MESVAFKTRARTIDHLGREQIADCPTAISELWKNAYDAYARSVKLEIYGGSTPVAAILDDGHGMSRDGFEAKWLVVGTESKVSGPATLDSDRKGLPIRPRQGQKGIGRLSSAYLGSLLLLVSKRDNSQFVAALIDWRLFENPFIYLQDIEIPIVEFQQPSELWIHLPALFDRLMGNVWGDGKDVERNRRLEAAWKSYDELEEAENRASTRAAIETSLIDAAFDERHLAQWPVWLGHSSSGTAMVMAHIAYDLQAQLQPASAGAQQDTAEQARNRLLQTLVNFTDPFLDASEKQRGMGVEDFGYSATAWDGELTRVIISDSRVFTYENLEELEHIIEGDFDSAGRFVGRVKAFGTWIDGDVILPAPVPIPTRVDSVVGAFHVRIGTFEQVLSKSTLSEAVHAQLSTQVERFGGFMVFRDGLRVMPYGRVDNDFFEIEQRRSIHAGRMFWSNRRMFGRVALSRAGNPNLRDKAGREGLIDNRSAKVFRDLVTNMLVQAARRYFGSDSVIRSEILPVIEEANKKQKAEEAQQKIRSRKRREFRRNLESALPKILEIERQVIEITEIAKADLLPADEGELLRLRGRVSELKAERGALALGPSPKNIGSLEPQLITYRRANAASAEMLVQASDSVSVALNKVRPKTLGEHASAELSRNAAYLHGRLRKWNAAAREILSSEMVRLSEMTEQRNKKYHSVAMPMITAMDDGHITLPELLTKLEQERDREDSENAAIYESYISTLRNLQDSVDIEAILSTSLDEVDDVKSELARLNGLAQLGITVEIIGHEMDGLEQTITRGLDAFPPTFKSTPPYRLVVASHKSLVEKLRFLSPLKLSGDKVKTWITGTEILEYVEGFIGDSLERRSISFEATDEFRRFSVYEQAARIYPVFINLINNCFYWVDRSDKVPKKILLDISQAKVVVADSGPGVSPEDIKSLFTLFFTRKIRSGRGVGLYLCRANLAAGGHTISYIEDSKQKRLSGANFLIDFKGAKYD